MKLNKSFKALTLVAALAGVCGNIVLQSSERRHPVFPAIPATGLKLPEGFNATLIADSLGPTRHIRNTSQGGIYVKLASPREGKGTLMLEPNGGQAVVRPASVTSKAPASI